MQPRFQINDLRFREKLRTMRERGPVARSMAARELAGVVLKRAIAGSEIVAYDTGRFIRSLEQAHNMLGVQPVSVTTLRQSRYSKKHLSQLIKEAEKWKRIEGEWLKIKRDLERREGYAKSKHYRNVLRTLDKVGNIRDRVIQNLEQIDKSDIGKAIVIGPRKRGNQYSLARVSQVITKVYGGVATVTDSGTRTLVVIRSKEPHARLVDSRTGVLRKQINEAKQVGLKRAGAAYITAVANGLGLQVSAGSRGRR